jgi:hypothetical protein
MANLGSFGRAEAGADYERRARVFWGFQEAGLFAGAGDPPYHKGHFPSRARSAGGKSGRYFG